MNTGELFINIKRKESMHKNWIEIFPDIGIQI